MNLTQVIREVRKLVKERPDFVYKSTDCQCYYISVANCEPCIFGQAIRNLDPDFDFSRYMPSKFCGIKKVIEENFTYTKKQLLWCMKVQFKQDLDVRWLDCIDIADREKPINLGYMNGWEENPVEYDEHVKYCSGKMVRTKVVSCLNDYKCNECGIVYRVDSSD